MRREAQFKQEFERLAAEWPETARFLVSEVGLFGDIQFTGGCRPLQFLAESAR